MTDKTVTVCDACMRACCWQGFFMCEDANQAGTVELTVDELEKMNLESPDYWQES